MFTAGKRKEARLVTEQLTAGYVAMHAFWALFHSGVLIPMMDGPVAPAEFAARSNMSAEILTALIEYLTEQGLLEAVEGGYTLAGPGRQLMEHAGTLELVRGHQGVLFMLEHLLAQLKTYGQGVQRRPDVVSRAQAMRWRLEVFPAIERAVQKARAKVVLDVGCNSGELLTFLAKKRPRVTGLGLCESGLLARLANESFIREKMNNRVRATVGPFADFRLQPLATLQHTDFPAAVWRRTDCMVLCDAFAEVTPRPEAASVFMKKLAASFPRAAFVVGMPCANEAFAAQTSGPELDLLLRLTQRTLLPEAEWETAFAMAGLEVRQHARLHTDGFAVWTLAKK